LSRLQAFIENQNAFRAWGTHAASTGKRQTMVEDWLRELAPTFAGRQIQVLDLGCGDGRSLDLFQLLLPDAVWRGVDIEASPEVASRTVVDDRLDTFDGVNLPYPDGQFDLIYSRQVFEHVRHPDALAREVARVLRPGGHFLGEVSYLEPYHSYSIFNFTPYGLAVVMRDAGLQVRELRAGIDALSLYFRQMIGAPTWLDFLFKRSPLNGLISVIGVIAALPANLQAFLKLQYCGQFSFLITKRES
jgi:SAM-dependent methyltransferase